MATPDKLKYAAGNSASTTLSSSFTGTDTSAPLTSDTNFSAKSGEGMVILDEGLSTEELAYPTGKSGSSLTIPVDNRGLEGGSAQAHNSGASVKGIFTAGMWNDLIDSAENVLVKTTGVLDTAKVVDLTTAQTLTNKTLTAPNLTTPSVTSGDLNLATGLNIQVNSADPKRAFYIPASAMLSATTSGAASGQSESSTNKVNYATLDFDKDADEYAHFGIMSPAYWDASTVTAIVYWTCGAAGAAETVTWAIQGMSFANDDALDQAYGTAVSVADTFIANGDVHVTSATTAITIGGTPTAGDWLQFRIYRDVSEDNLAVDAKLLGIRIEFGVAKFNDA